MSESGQLIKIACPNCGAIFEVPVEFGGQLGECTECDVVFEIPTVAGPDQQEMEVTETGSIKIEDFREVEDTDTHTVKLSRDTIGMIPNIQSQFKVDVVTKSKQMVNGAPGPGTNGNQPSAPGPRPATTTKKKAMKNSRTNQAKQPAPKPKKKWWHFW